MKTLSITERMNEKRKAENKRKKEVENQAAATKKWQEKEISAAKRFLGKELRQLQVDMGSNNLECRWSKKIKQIQLHGKYFHGKYYYPLKTYILTFKNKKEITVGVISGMVDDPYNGDPDFGYMPPSWKVRFFIKSPSNSKICMCKESFLDALSTEILNILDK